MSEPFSPSPASTVNVSVSASTQRVQMVQTPRIRQVRAHNAGSALAFIEFGDVTVVATLASSTPVPAGAIEVFTVQDATHVAAIAVGSTGTIYFTHGTGI